MALTPSSPRGAPGRRRPEPNAIAPGTYVLRFSSGIDWDEGARRFPFEPTYSEFPDPQAYAEPANATEYTEVEVTLHPVVGGNVRTNSISAEQFNLTALVRR